ncbi:MAG: TIGR00730 family Rossman fold protein [Anaerolineales bacterium]|nr:TIGR00730 family Rossman fold protein [Anaerolineales bacterium]
MKTICVYCGSSDKLHPDYLEAARAMGATIARRGLGLVYGAGSTGLMGALADGALHGGCQVIGVIPTYFNTPQLAHTGLSRLEVVDTIHTRKARMAELADGFIALPGGFGTLEELFEMLTWAQIGLHRKPIGLLNVRGYFDHLLAMIARAQHEGFIYREHMSLLANSDSPEQLLELLESYLPPQGLEKWVNRD